MALPNEPITKQEMYLSNIAGQNTALPDEPITREEMYLDYIAKSGGTGEGDMKKSVYDSDNAVASAGGIKMFVNQKIGTLPQRVGSLETTAGVLEGEVASIEDTLDNLGTASTKNSTSVVTSSSDLVESGAVKDIVGWGNVNLFDINTALNGYIDAEGNFVSYASFKASDYLPIKAGEAYTLSYNRFTTEFGTGMRIAWYQADKTFIRRDGITETSALGKKSTSAVAPENAVYARISNPYWGNVGNNSADIQFEVGSTATAYEPYHASVEESKCDNSVIGTVEGANASKAWSVGEHFISGGQFKEVTQAIASGGAISDSNTVDKPIADCLVKQATFSATTQSNGNFTLTTDNIVLIAIKGDATVLFEWYQRSQGGYTVHAKNYDGTDHGSTAVSGTYYYI